jgi:phosphate transport system protein
MPRSGYQLELQNLRDQCVLLGTMVDEAVQRAVMSLDTHDRQLAENVIYEDRIVNRKRYRIEDAAIDLIALQQPVASDLRTVFAVLSIAVELERIGDYAVSIGKTTLQTSGRPLLGEVPELREMADKACGMLRHAMDAFVTQDVAAARAVIAQDDEVDRLYQRANQALVALMLENRDDIEQASYLIRMSHNLERIADRVTNICERVQFQVTGRLQEAEAVAT